ncbi:hypothetical protein BOTBODRAFT_124915 [Botryobasidium botryosum FD-172 SS1]|uniref:C2H2-type domain-containing protein n=1 Tax=Botryobasidium botryosum (strain FD-172 SS1) TaxID=930990 RepID=A0A067NA48_BOTB1|nr:hypothetical protein BOTBODRAFT_124915 [Botryobasidium botryosum FD-172 SS1]
MAKKKTKQVLRPWCWYCEREFEDEKVLMQHQKAKHFKCKHCPRRLNTAGGLAVHIQQVHKLEPDRIENALPGRDGGEVEIFGMEGIPKSDLEDWKRRKEAELGLSSGSISGQHQAKRPRVDYSKPISEEELAAQLAAHRALMSGNSGGASDSPAAPAQGSPGGTVYGAPQTYTAPPMAAPFPPPPGMMPGMFPGGPPPPGFAGPPPGFPFPPGMPPPPGMPMPPFMQGRPPFPPFPPGQGPPLPPGAPLPPIHLGGNPPPGFVPPPGVPGQMPGFVPPPGLIQPPFPPNGAAPSPASIANPAAPATPNPGTADRASDAVAAPPLPPTLSTLAPLPEGTEVNPPLRAGSKLIWTDASYSPEERRSRHPKYAPIAADIISEDPTSDSNGEGAENRGKKRARAEDFL